MSNAKVRHRRRRRRYAKNKLIDLGNGLVAIVPRQWSGTKAELLALPELDLGWSDAKPAWLHSLK